MAQDEQESIGNGLVLTKDGEIFSWDGQLIFSPRVLHPPPGKKSSVILEDDSGKAGPNDFMNGGLVAASAITPNSQNSVRNSVTPNGTSNMPTPSTPPESQFPKALRESESEKIAERHRILGHEFPHQVGLALSGGGIRSATFCLGVLQAMATHRWIRNLDYLSTVSGGGYAGSFLGRMFTRDWIKDISPTPPKRGWPTDVDTAVKITGSGFQAKRVEAVLHDSRSTPLQWLRESGRYLAPTGGGDEALAAAVAVRNCVAVLLVIVTALLAVFLVGAAARATLWNWPFWHDEVEGMLMNAAKNHWWWSPLAILPALSFCLFTLPLGWAYWLTQKGGRSQFTIAPWLTVIAVIALCALVTVGFIRSHATPHATICVALVVGVSGVLTLLYYVLALFATNCRNQPVRENNPAANGIPSESDEKQINIERNILSRWFSVALLATAGLLVLAVVDSFGQMAYAFIRGHGPYGLREFLGATGLLALFGLAPRIKMLLDLLPNRKTAQIPVSLVAGIAAIVLGLALLTAVSAVAHGFAWGWQNPGVTYASKQTDEILAVKLTDQNLIQVLNQSTGSVPGASSEMSWPRAVSALGTALFLTLLFGHTLTFLNLSSHQSLYAARISRAYHGASNPDRWSGKGQRLGDSLPSDDALWLEYRPHESGGPLHIVNVTLNETVSGKSQIEYRDRKGLIIAVGPAGMTVGSRFHSLWGALDKTSPQDEVTPIPPPNAATKPHGCYHPLAADGITPDSNPAQKVERLSLSRWIGISGAAFTTGLGKGTTLGKSFLLGLANIRLGYWWNSNIDPGRRRNRDYVHGNPLREWLAWLFPVQTHLFDEFLAKFYGPNSQLWYLSDGGHSDNTGAYELVRRRVPLIILCDCGCDSNYAFEDLAQLVRMIRVDFGVETEFLDDLALDKEDLGASRALFGPWNDFTVNADDAKDEADSSDKNSQRRPHALLARVWHPGENNEPRGGGASLLLVLKPSLSGDEPLDVTNYHIAHPDFPQESTLDQFFDEAQWESYRKLGWHIANQLFDGDPPWLKLLPQCKQSA